MKTIFAPLSVLALALTSASALALPMTDFEDGTLSGWHKGSAAAIPMEVGTEADGNKYLRYISNGPDAPEHDKRVTFMAGNDYRGNYNAMGAKTIRTRMKNNGPVELSMQAAFGNTLAGLRTRYSTEAVIVPADGEWYDVVFDLESNLHMVGIGGHGKSSAAFSAAEVLGNISSLRFLHGVLGEVYLARRGPFDGYNAGEEVVADLWVDDIEVSTLAADYVSPDVSAVPLPAAAWLFLSGITGLVVSRKRAS